MRKKALNISLMIIVLFCSTSILCACSNNNNDNITPPPGVIEIVSPYIFSFGSYISWESIKNVSSYEIYENGNLRATTTDTKYNVGELKDDTNFYIWANSKTYGSKKSNEITVSKNTDFNDDEILDLSVYDSYSSTIPASIRKVIIGKKYSTTFNLLTKIGHRDTDLTFDLYNVSINGYIHTNDGSYLRSQHNFNLIFNLTGSCSITGDDGQNGASFSASFYDNNILDGKDGSNGTTAVIAPTVFIKGKGNLLLSGGNGGNGGNGSATTEWETSACPGTGSNGGDGGAGIKTSYLILNLDEQENTVSVHDGSGGKKGTPGVNGSIITGPVCSLIWDSEFDIGKNGKDGVSVLGVKNIIKGKLLL